jgi:hypothetical protein
MKDSYDLVPGRRSARVGKVAACRDTEREPITVHFVERELIPGRGWMRRELYPRLAPDKPADAQLDEASEWEPIPVE